MPLNALRSFEAAARLGSFKAASDELAVTPSAISLQIRRLEQLIGRPLFVRGHRSVVLSDVGALVAPQLSELFSRMEQLLDASIGPESNLLRVSAMPSFAHQWLAPRLGRFLARWPQYQVRIAGEDRLVSFDRDPVDVGIRYGRGDHANLHVELIAHAEAFPVCSPEFYAAHADRLSSPSGLLELPLIEDELARDVPELPTWERWLHAAGVRTGRNHAGPRFESLHMALMGAASGQGVALALGPLARAELASGRLVRLFEVAVPSAFSFWLVCRPERMRERKIAAFREWVAGEARRDP